MSYKNQWKAFEDIKRNQHFHLNNLATLCELFKELSQIEKQYVDGLSKVEVMVSSLSDSGTLGKIFEMFKQNIKTKKDNHSILEQLSRNLFVKDALILFETEQSKNEDTNSKEEKNYNDMVYQVKEAKRYYDKQMELIEKELSSVIEKGNSDEIAAAKENSIKKGLIIRVPYCDIILRSNDLRDKYEKEINELLKECVNHDQLYLVSCANKFSTYFHREKEILKQLSNADEEMYNVCCQINVEDDLNAFSKNNHRHGQPPNCFDFEAYQVKNDFWSPQSNLTKLKGFKHNLRDFFKKNFGYFPPEGILDKTIVEKFIKLEERAVQSWNGTIDPKSLEALEEDVKDKRLANRYLRFAHQARINMIPLNSKAYAIIVNLMKTILKASIVDLPYNYDYIYQIILLSQTFYMMIDETKPNNNANQKFLQIEIMKEEMWKDKELWLGLVNYAFETEMRKDSKTVTDTLSNRIQKENTTMIITLTTFQFIMTSYNCDVGLIKEIIQEYCVEYKIDEKSILINEEANTKTHTHTNETPLESITKKTPQSKN